MTPEDRFNAVVETAFRDYRAEVEDGTRQSLMRLREVREATARVLRTVYEVNWLNTNTVEGERL